MSEDTFCHIGVHMHFYYIYRQTEVNIRLHHKTPKRKLHQVIYYKMCNYIELKSNETPDQFKDFLKTVNNRIIADNCRLYQTIARVI